VSALASPPEEAGTAGEPPALYERFYHEVARRQVRDWLPDQPARIFDVSRDRGRHAVDAAAMGHTVVRLRRPDDEPAAIVPASGRVAVVEADALDLSWLRAASVDAVLAEGCALSAHLAVESSLGCLSAALRPGGRLLLSVDSLVDGLARLAAMGSWAELADAPAADVVLVPDEDGTLTRCLWPEELRAMLVAEGFDVEWVRSRTILPRDGVEQAGERALEQLVETELELAVERDGEAVGRHLVASAVKR
jgi:SAM-dependent methyltransferase